MRYQLCVLLMSGIPVLKKLAEAFLSNRKNIIPIFILACLLQLCSVNKGLWELGTGWHFVKELCTPFTANVRIRQFCDSYLWKKILQNQTLVFELVGLMRKQASGQHFPFTPCNARLAKRILTTSSQCNYTNQEWKIVLQK